MDTMKRTNGTAGRLAKMSGDSYKMVIEHMVAQQERNVRFGMSCSTALRGRSGTRPRAPGAL
jgi:hypothetical protein